MKWMRLSCQMTQGSSLSAFQSSEQSKSCVTFLRLPLAVIIFMINLTKKHRKNCECCPGHSSVSVSVSQKPLKSLSKVFKSLSKVTPNSLKILSKVSEKFLKSLSKSLKSLAKASQKPLKSLSKVSQKSLKSLSRVSQESLSRLIKTFKI